MTTIFSKLKNAFLFLLGASSFVFAISCAQESKYINENYMPISSSRSDDQDFNSEGEEEELEPCDYCIEFRGGKEVLFNIGFNFMADDLNFEYSYDKKKWNTWELVDANGGRNKRLYAKEAMPDSADRKSHIYVRGNGNKKITNGTNNAANHVVIEKLSSKLIYGNIECIGNIETLLDWKTVRDGGHPEMGDRAFAFLFAGCTALKSAPELLSTTLSDGCYMAMFQSCVYLKKGPSVLPATNIAKQAYFEMFDGCSDLTNVPSVLAEKASEGSFDNMLQYCNNIKISKVQTEEYSQPFIVEVDMPNIKGDVSEAEKIENEAISLKARTLYFSTSAQTALGFTNINPADFQPEIVIDTEEPASDNPTPNPPTPASDDPTPTPPAPATDDPTPNPPTPNPPTPATDNKPSQTNTATGSGKALTTKPGSKSPKELAKSGAKKPFTGGVGQSGTGVIRL